ncbi:hypothetical protein C2845_PM12G11090 [Panicum miliaceum]|uniref:Uncharacterized protein n=1 Tax=Panicum miliaceum TaxID=4540 RepID=A0A3L6QJD9_PANMI|nr:hypothetical protein C2845_PM12G11090 [Panicum miliaceum]
MDGAHQASSRSSVGSSSPNGRTAGNSARRDRAPPRRQSSRPASRQPSSELKPGAPARYDLLHPAEDTARPLLHPSSFGQRRPRGKISPSVQCGQGGCLLVRDRLTAACRLPRQGGETQAGPPVVGRLRPGHAAAQGHHREDLRRGEWITPSCRPPCGRPEGNLPFPAGRVGKAEAFSF